MLSTYLPKSTSFVPAGTDLGVKLLRLINWAVAARKKIPKLTDYGKEGWLQVGILLPLPSQQDRSKNSNATPRARSCNDEPLTHLWWSPRPVRMECNIRNRLWSHNCDKTQQKLGPNDAVWKKSTPCPPSKIPKWFNPIHGRPQADHWNWHQPMRHNWWLHQRPHFTDSGRRRDGQYRLMRSRPSPSIRHMLTSTMKTSQFPGRQWRREINWNQKISSKNRK
jgi:hypothetical protein